jgi:hypothetical protein
LLLLAQLFIAIWVWVYVCFEFGEISMELERILVVITLVDSWRLRRHSLPLEAKKAEIGLEKNVWKEIISLCNKKGWQLSPSENGILVHLDASFMYNAIQQTSSAKRAETQQGVSTRRQACGCS